MWNMKPVIQLFHKVSISHTQTQKTYSKIEEPQNLLLGYEMNYSKL